MKRANQKNIVSYVCISIIGLILLIGLFGCGSIQTIPKEKQVLISYEATGELLKTSKATLMAFCDNGTMSAEDCTKARMTFNNAVAVYHALGTVAIEAVDTGESGLYRTLAGELAVLLTVLDQYIGDN